MSSAPNNRARLTLCILEIYLALVKLTCIELVTTLYLYIRRCCNVSGKMSLHCHVPAIFLLSKLILFVYQTVHPLDYTTIILFTSIVQNVSLRRHIAYITPILQ